MRSQNMGDNIVKNVSRTLPYSADSFTSLYHYLDLKHSVVTGFQYTIHISCWIGNQWLRGLDLWLYSFENAFQNKLPGSSVPSAGLDDVELYHLPPETAAGESKCCHTSCAQIWHSCTEKIQEK